DSFVASQSSICNGATTTLFVNGSLGSATSWNLYTESCGGTLVTSNATGIFDVNPVANTTYYVRAEGGCSPPGACASVDIQIKTVPASITRSGDTFIATPAGATYQWINCDGNTNIDGETGRFFALVEPGSYAVQVTQNGCSSNSECVDYVIVGLQDEVLEEISIHPNPAHSSVKLRLPNSGKHSIMVTDSQGRSVLNSSAIDANEFELNIETLNRGLYFIHIQSQRVVKTVKLIVN
ncbi:MAG: T9SS type A sorting domain-containing protein, partial [Cyclobacteriaceae bacterium]|nr:T9SS type A sorting domain-containing protein [Cyclobacteriaceae bacterium]